MADRIGLQLRRTAKVRATITAPVSLPPHTFTP